MGKCCEHQMLGFSNYFLLAERKQCATANGFSCQIAISFGTFIRYWSKWIFNQTVNYASPIVHSHHSKLSFIRNPSSFRKCSDEDSSRLQLRSCSH